MSQRLLSALAVFDDAALEGITNKGLVRRAAKDVEAGKAEVTMLTDKHATVVVDGETVVIGASGPRTAACTCPAKDICRHKLAAVVALRNASTGALISVVSETPLPQAPPVAAATTQTAPPPSAPATTTQATPPPDPLAECLALDHDAIAVWAGKARLRDAIELLAETTAVSATIDGAALLITVGSRTIRYLAGQGLDGMVSKTPPQRKKALHAAAILAVHRLHGRAFELAAKPTAEDSTVEPIKGADPTFLDRVRTALTDAIATAFLQAPLVLEDRLFELSVSSRADDLPRLSGALRGLSADIAARRERDPSLEPVDMLKRLAAAYALAEALAHAAPTFGNYDTLRGAVRQDYAPIGDLSLDGLGARFWETASGARGVTAYFHAEEPKRIVTASLARAAGQDPTFKPQHAFAHEMVWGNETLASLASSRFKLTSAALAPTGRLSLSSTTRSQLIGPSLSGAAPADWSIAHRSWRDLEQALRLQFQPTLARPMLSDCVLLVPAAHGKAKFDEIEQCYQWPVCDAAGRWISLTLPHDPADELIGARLTRLSCIAAIQAILAEPSIDGDVFRLEPISVVAATPSEPCPSLYALHVSRHGLEAPSRSMLDHWLDWLSRAPLGAPPVADKFGRAPSASSQSALFTGLLDDLLAVAELGSRQLSDRQRQQFASHAAKLDRFGFAKLSQATKSISAGERIEAGHLLKLVHMLDRQTAMQRQLPTLQMMQTVLY